MLGIFIGRTTHTRRGNSPSAAWPCSPMLISFGNMLEEHFFPPALKCPLKDSSAQSFKSSPFQRERGGDLLESSGPSVALPALSKCIRPSFFSCILYPNLVRRTKKQLWKRASRSLMSASGAQRQNTKGHSWLSSGCSTPSIFHLNM